MSREAIAFEQFRIAASELQNIVVDRWSGRVVSIGQSLWIGIFAAVAAEGNQALVPQKTVIRLTYE